MGDILQERLAFQSSLAKNLISEKCISIPLCHLRACVTKSKVAKHEYVSLFRGFMLGAFDESHDMSYLKGFNLFISVHSSIFENLLVILSGLDLDATRDLFDKSEVHDLLVHGVATIFLWLNSLNAFFSSEPYLSGRIEVSEPRVLFMARSQMQLYITRALELLRFCFEERSIGVITSEEAKDLISMSSLCEDCFIHIQLIDTLFLVWKDDNNRDILIVRSIWKLLCSKNMKKNISSELLLRPSPIYRHVCDRLRTQCVSELGSNEISNMLMGLEKKVLDEYQDYNVLTHCVLAYWGALMNRSFNHILSFCGIVHILNSGIQKFQRGTLEKRKKNTSFGDETIFLTNESLFHLYDITFQLIIASIFHCLVSKSNVLEGKNDAIVAFFDCFGSMIKSLELYHDLFPKSLIYSSVRACIVMVDICHEQIENVVESGRCLPQSRISSSFKSVLSTMKVECCDRITSLSDKLIRVVPVGEKATLKTLMKKSECLSVHIYRSGIAFRMVPSSLEIFGATSAISSNRSKPQKQHRRNNGILQDTSEFCHEQEDESFAVTGDWGYDDDGSNSIARGIQLEPVL